MKKILLFASAALSATFAAGASSPAANPPSPVGAPTIAIVIRAADAGSKYLAAEYARDLIHLFGGIERLTVIPRARVLMAEASDETPADIGRALPATLKVVRSCSHYQAADRSWGMRRFLRMEVLGINSAFGDLNLWRAPSWAEIEAAEK